MPPIHVVTPVWGAAYTRCFLEFGLGSLLAPGNLPSLGEPRGLLHVFTTEADRDVMEASPLWQRMRAVADCRIDLIAPTAVNTREPHASMSECHRRAIEFADSRNAAMVFYNPDVVLADGGMKTLLGLLARGKRAIQVIGLRLIKEEVAPLLCDRYLAPDGSVAISPRELVGIAVKHLHPITMMHLYEAEDIDLMPQEVLWKVGEEGIVARCFHVHPILVYPRVRNAPFSTTVDDDYLRAACPDPAEEYVVTDSDEFCLCELSGMDRHLTGVARTGDGADIASWAWRYARPHHFEHLCRRILMHSRDVGGPDWDAACSASDEIVQRVLDHLIVREAEAAGAAER